MKSLKTRLFESEESLEQEMKKWEERYKSPFGQALKELQWLINDLGLYAAQKNENGLYTFTPFDNYVTAYSLDGNKERTFNKVKEICDDWDFSQYNKVKKVLNKLEKLSK